MHRIVEEIYYSLNLKFVLDSIDWAVIAIHQTDD